MYKQLTEGQRYTISVLYQIGFTKKKIAEAINVNPATITREMSRNSGKQGRYNYKTAQANAMYHRQRSASNRTIGEDVKEEVVRLLENYQWSPKQISGHLAEQGITISHESIYRMIRKDKKEGGTLYLSCRHKLKHRSRPVGGSVAHIPNRVSISERPKEANGKRFGDFEMDTIVGPKNSGAIVTIIERSTNMLFMRKLKHGKNAKELAKTVIHLLYPFRENVRTITTDNGLEFACHEMITKSIGAPVYFADPYSSWQKGAIENANGLIRQYIKKSMPISAYSHQEITKIRNKINQRPREKLNFSTPEKCFYENFRKIALAR